MADLFLDGKYLGRIGNPDNFVKEFRKLRREGKIPYTVNIAYHKDLDEVRILSCAGL